MFGIKMDKLNKKKEYKNQEDTRKKEREREQKHSQWEHAEVKCK